MSPRKIIGALAFSLSIGAAVPALANTPAPSLPDGGDPGAPVPHAPIILSAQGQKSAKIGCDNGNIRIVENGKRLTSTGSNDYTIIACPDATIPFQVEVQAANGSLEIKKGGEKTPAITLGFVASK